MLEAIAFVHFRGLAHRDLKPENILIDENYDIKIADFGMVTRPAGNAENSLNMTPTGSEMYRAPELVEQRPYNAREVDLYALGILLFILIDGLPPFSSADIEHDQVYKILATGRSETFWKFVSQGKSPGYFSDDFKDLVTTMLEYNPSMRLSIADILAHPWVTDSDIATRE